MTEMMRRMIDVACDLGAGSIAFCRLYLGLLTGNYLEGVPGSSRAATTDGLLRDGGLADGVIAAARALDAVARGRGQTLAQMALSWGLRDPRVTSVPIGASRPERIGENGKAVVPEAVVFADEELARVGAILAGVKLPPSLWAGA